MSQQQGSIDKVREAIVNLHNITAEHYERIEAKTDAGLAATERHIAALRDLKHTALWIAAGLIVAGYVIVKVL